MLVRRIGGDFAILFETTGISDLWVWNIITKIKKYATIQGEKKLKKIKNTKK